MPLVVTIDVEDWPQSTLSPDLPLSERAEYQVEHLLDVLAEEKARVTCFVLGKFLEKFPRTVSRIVAEGHEIASHGHGHVDVFKQSPAEFREDVRRAKKQLEDWTGRKVVGYRAPAFSIVRESLWALEILEEEGFLYDSSINPAVSVRYGVSNWPRQPVRVTFPSGRSLLELPMATAQAFGRAWPVAGGGYHRLLPWTAIRLALSRALNKGEVFVSYCHPYEFDPEEFHHLTYALPLKTRLHQGLGRGSFEDKFRRMLGCFETVSAESLIHRTVWPAYIPPAGYKEGSKV